MAKASRVQARQVKALEELNGRTDEQQEQLDRIEAMLEQIIETLDELPRKRGRKSKKDGNGSGEDT